MTRTFGYDANGERVRETNGLNQSTQYGLDSLHRVKTLTDAANASASLKYNALDAVTEATDFKGVMTNFTRDAQGNAVAEAGTDIGARSTTYDALGLPSQIVDAMGQATTVQRDALGRPTQLSFADGKRTRSFPNAASYACVGSTTQRCRPSRSLRSMPRRAIQSLDSNRGGVLAFIVDADVGIAACWQPDVITATERSK